MHSLTPGAVSACIPTHSPCAYKRCTSSVSECTGKGREGKGREGKGMSGCVSSKTKLCNAREILDLGVEA